MQDRKAEKEGFLPTHIRSQRLRRYIPCNIPVLKCLLIKGIGTQDMVMVDLGRRGGIAVTAESAGVNLDILRPDTSVDEVGCRGAVQQHHSAGESGAATEILYETSPPAMNARAATVVSWEADDILAARLREVRGEITGNC